MEDHYNILGIKRSATPEEVKKAYFVMAKKYHPDSGDDAEVKKFHEVAEAYKVLSDPDAREAYDLASDAKEEEKKKVEAGAAFHSAHVPQRDAYRDVELKEFHRNRYKKAVMRVIGFSLFVGAIAYFVSIVIGGTAPLGALAGLLIGFSLSINKNFNVNSFFHSKKSGKSFRVFTWFLFALGLGYFVWLIAIDLIPF